MSFADIADSDDIDGYLNVLNFLPLDRMCRATHTHTIFDLIGPIFERVAYKYGVVR